MSTAEAGLGIAGIVISLVTFWLGYKQTIGAKQERIRTADADIEATVLKRILLEAFEPTHDELRRFIRGKAISSGLNLPDLRPAEDLVPVLWARLLEDDLVTAERRSAALSALLAERKLDDEGERVTVAGAVSVDVGRRRARRQVELMAILALGAAVVGTAVSAVPALRGESAGLDAKDLAAVFAAALVVIGSLATVLTFRSAAPTVAFGDAASGDANFLRTYPDRDEGLQALDRVCQLSPLAVAALRAYADDEVLSARSGMPRGRFVRTGGTPWHEELVREGLLKDDKPPGYLDPRGRRFLVLTDEGKSVARLAAANEPVPGWLREAIQQDAGDARGQIPLPSSDGIAESDSDEPLETKA